MGAYWRHGNSQSTLVRCTRVYFQICCTYAPTQLQLLCTRTIGTCAMFCGILPIRLIFHVSDQFIFCKYVYVRERGTPFCQIWKRINFVCFAFRLYNVFSTFASHICTYGLRGTSTKIRIELFQIHTGTISKQ